MKFSSKAMKCGLSPMRKFHPFAVAAQEKGRKIYHLNIGQPDIETPPSISRPSAISNSPSWSTRPPPVCLSSSTPSRITMPS